MRKTEHQQKRWCHSRFRHKPQKPKGVGGIDGVVTTSAVDGASGVITGLRNEVVATGKSNCVVAAGASNRVVAAESLNRIITGGVNDDGVGGVGPVMVVWLEDMDVFEMVGGGILLTTAPTKGAACAKTTKKSSWQCLYTWEKPVPPMAVCRFEDQNQQTLPS